jgi:hypothetical protein
VTVLLRAKFKVNSKTQFEGNKYKIELYPVYGNSPENQVFWEATPGGHLTLEVVKENAAAYFEVGQEYYIDFTKALQYIGGEYSEYMDISTSN